MSEKYELIDTEKASVTGTGEKRYTVVQMCEWLEVSTSGYYEWHDRPDSGHCAAAAIPGVAREESVRRFR